MDKATEEIIKFYHEELDIKKILKDALIFYGNNHLTMEEFNQFLEIQKEAEKLKK